MSLWMKIGNFFKEWDGTDTSKTLELTVDDLREIESMDKELMELRFEKNEVYCWNPCSKKLPERCVSVLVQVDEKIMVAFCDKDDKWYGLHGGFIMGKPLAWMPLPELYKVK